MKKITKKVILLFLFMVMTNAVSGQTPETLPDTTGMGKDAQTWVKEIKMGWNLGNSLESAGAQWDDANGTWINISVTDFNEWETAWGNPKTTKEMLSAVKNAGFDAIRIPVRWLPHVINQTTMEVDAKWMSRVKQIVDWCMELNLKVILNTHHELWLEYHPTYDRQTENNRKLSALWKQIATTFRDYGSSLAFAGINEVQVNWQAPTKENNDVMNGYNQTFIDAVRSTGGKNYYRNLIIQTYSCNPQYGLQGLVMPTDVVKNRLSVEFHYYSPYKYCGAGDGCYYYWGSAYKDKGSIPSEDEIYLRNLFAQIKRQWYDKGYGVIIGEYGVSDHYTSSDTETQKENMQYYLKCVMSEAKRHGFAGFVWDNNYFGNGTEKFGIFNRRNNMSVDEGYFLKGITDGSLTGFDENSSNDDKSDNDYVGSIFWSGNAALDWGNGLQLNIPAQKFSDFTEKSKIVFTYTTDTGADYDMIQLLTGKWVKLSKFLINGQEYAGEFTPAYSTESQTSAVSFDTSVLEELKTNGMNIQGHGIHLLKVLLSDGTTDIRALVVNGNKNSSSYSIDGMETTRLLPYHIYIKNGKKFVASK